jgi:hypothetical protein
MKRLLAVAILALGLLGGCGGSSSPKTTTTTAAALSPEMQRWLTQNGGLVRQYVADLDSIVRAIDRGDSVSSLRDEVISISDTDWNAAQSAEPLPDSVFDARFKDVTAQARMPANSILLRDSPDLPKLRDDFVTAREQFLALERALGMSP